MDMNGYETSKLCMRVWYFVIAVVCCRYKDKNMLCRKDRVVKTYLAWIILLLRKSRI